MAALIGGLPPPDQKALDHDLLSRWRDQKHWLFHPKWLSGCSGVCNATGYKLLAQGELDSFLVGRSRRITMASIRALIARRVADAKEREAG